MELIGDIVFRMTFTTRHNRYPIYLGLVLPLIALIVAPSNGNQIIKQAMDMTINFSTSVVERPAVIYTFYHRIDPKHRSTGMTDEDDAELLSFWKESWMQAGWEPVVLSLQDAEKHPQYDSFKHTVDSLHLDEFSTLLFTRWIAMAGVDGGGWYADYDVFPLTDFTTELPNNGTMTIHDIMSPTLASGTDGQWMNTLNALLDDAVETKKSKEAREKELMFWTDSLGILNLVTKCTKNPPCPQRAKRVAMPYGAKDPIVTSAGCDSKSFRSRWVVHFGQEMMQAAEFVPPHLRLPSGRLSLARDWLPKWRKKCYQPSEILIS